MAEENASSQAEPRTGIPTIRSTSVQRIFADVSVCSNLPEGVEIALFQRSHNHQFARDADQAQSILTSRVLVDVARIRMADDDATTLAFNILYEIAESGIYDLEPFEKNVEVIRAAIKKSSDEPSL